MRILVVEDEIKLNRALVTALQSRGYTAEGAFDGEEGERLALWHKYDVIVMDIMMPKKDGIEVSKTLRSKGITTPIIMLTAKDAVSDKVAGLDGGADDYLVKPFSFEELVARIRSLLRRPAIQTADILIYQDLSLDTRTSQVSIKGKLVELTLREYGLLEYFLRNQNMLMTRDELLEHIWDRNYDGMSNVVDVHIKNLRKKLPTHYASHIHTIWGKGYQFIS